MVDSPRTASHGHVALAPALRPFAHLHTEPDSVAVRVVARLRITVSVAVAASGSFVTDLDSRQEAAFLFLGLFWVPAAAVVLLATDTPGNRLAVRGGPLADMAVLVATHAILPGTATATLLGYVVVVAFATYTGGTRFGALLAAVGLGTTIVVRDLTTTSREAELSTIALFGVVLFGLVFLLDRTAAVQSRTAARSARFETKADTIIARVADAVVVTDAGSRILQWSPAAERILGRPAREAVGLSCTEILGLHVGERRLDCSNGCPLVAHSGELYDQEAWRADDTGRRQPLLVSTSVIPAQDGSPAEVVHSLRDVTRLKQAEEAKTLFLATASHELKTPLTVIAGFAATLLSGTEMEEGSKRQALEAINRRATDLTKIVDRLLLSSRIEAGRVQVMAVSVDIVPLVVERVEAVRAARGRTTVLEAPEHLPEVVADPQAVVTALDHLLDNAMKYSPGGDPVAVTLWADGGGVHLSVRDRGIGMDPEQVSRCFDKFWQAESSDVRRFGGTGIGLYIVRSLVEAMGGTVAVDSTPGAGSRFTITLQSAATPASRFERPGETAGRGERTSIEEFMRQIGVPRRVEG